MFTHMRIARPVTDPDRSFLLYSNGLGLQKLGAFNDHAGFDGIMLGRADLGWHLEFTHCQDHPVKPLPTEEDLLVLYFSDEQAWRNTGEKMLAAGFIEVRSFNPYWAINGKTFADHDGYRVVLQNRSWV